MKSLLMATVAVFAMGSVAHAEQTMGEKAKETVSEAGTEMKKAGRATKRAAKKAGNRVEEATCMEGDMKCAAKKAGNRMGEAKDGVVDGVKNTADDVTD